MPDYEKMYFMLFNKISDLIEELQKIQNAAEELYITSSEKIEQGESSLRLP